MGATGGGKGATGGSMVGTGGRTVGTVQVGITWRLERGHGLWLCIGSTCDLYCRGAYVLGHTPARWLTHSVVLLLLQMSSGGSAVVVDQISQPLSFNTPGGCGSIGTSCSTIFSSCSCTSVLLPGCWFEWGLSAEYLQCCGSKGLCPRCLH